LVDEPLKNLSPSLLVSNARSALGQLAATHRQAHDIPVIAVAGSNGKTSTKEMLAAILRESGNTLHSPASFNNDIGVPLTLLQLNEVHRAAVVELGTNHPGELAPLMELAAPTHGILTGIGREHLEYFGDLAGVVREEGNLGELLPESGKLFLYGDGPWVKALAERSPAEVITAGFGPTNHWCVETVRLTEEGTVFAIIAPEAEWCGEYRTPLLGKPQAGNAALALAAACAVGLNPENAREGLAGAPVPAMRMQWQETGGVRWLNDAYNANVDSVLAALDTLTELDCRGHRIAVIGTMAELGEHTEQAHAEAGAAAGALDGLLAVGEHAAVTAQAAREAGVGRVAVATDVDEAVVTLRDWLQSGDVVLLKASRAARLDEVCRQF
jgi:UDP-N-acetylmuramoyl-tripeptide--D-alanyl-D-alanine ligase